ncbi:MAG: acyl carrier protein [Oscillospiraceae bacterium]|nr:acyl carrier protein [Oscillospiraceae bacterium]MDD6502281.1 acyl carrier protein [Oscillospiraceae bacterium]MDY4105073.1 acyl carrier protein [Oscillospiraceae bacterium]
MNIQNRIMEMVADRFNKSVEDLTRDTEFVSDLSADSLDQVELTIDIEDEFGLPEVPEDALVKIVTIGDLVDYVESALEA